MNSMQQTLKMRGIGGWREESCAPGQQDCQGQTRRNCDSYYRKIVDHTLTTYGNSGDQFAHYYTGNFAWNIETWSRFFQKFESSIDKNQSVTTINPLTPNDDYSGRTAPLNSKRCILYIYSTNTDTEYYKHIIYSPFCFSSKCSFFHNSNVFGSCFIHILYTECAEI